MPLLRIKELERVIRHLDTLWDQDLPPVHPDTGDLVSNQEYDGLRIELKKLHPKSDIFDNATATKTKDIGKKYKHHPPLTSIEKASHEDRNIQTGMLHDWLESTGLPADKIVQAYKLDGAALALYYVKGKLAAAATRPRRGDEGEDVTAQVKHIKDIPQQLKLPVTCSIRGELICKLPAFAQVSKIMQAAGEDLPANPRNYTAGAIRNFSNPDKASYLSFIGYSIEGLANPPYQTEMERAIWCNKHLGIRFVQVRPYRFEDLQKMEDNVPNLDYEVDGVVLSVDNLEDQEQLGRHGDRPNGNPKGKIAWKFAEEEANPIVKSIEAQTGRTGKIAFVACFDPVPLAGTMVSRVTLHNAGFIVRNKITIGTMLRVLKAGKIIPKVIGVVSDQGKFKFPAKCPSCGQPVLLVEGGTKEMLELVCNNLKCPAQSVAGFSHYLDTCGVLGLGESRIGQLVEGGAVKTPADFYRLDVPRAMQCGLTERQALLAIASIHMIPAPEKFDNNELQSKIESAKKHKKEIPLWQLFASLGIESAGKAAGKALVDHFGNFDSIRTATIEQLYAVKDIGQKTAEIIFHFFKSNKALVDDLLKYVDGTLPKTGKLTGITFCFSGGFDEGKTYWEEMVESLGGRCAGSVSKKINYLVAGNGSMSKSEKAKELEIPIISIEDLQKML